MDLPSRPLKMYTHVAIDTECTGLNWWKDQPFMFSLSLPDGGGDFVWDCREEPRIIEYFMDEMPSCNVVIGHNIKFDMHMCENKGILLPRYKAQCTMIRAALLNEHLMSYKLDDLAAVELGVRKEYDGIIDDLAKVFGGKATKNTQMPNMHRALREAPPYLQEKIKQYAKVDARLARLLWEKQESQLRDQELVPVHNLETRLLYVIQRMERGGVKVDVNKAHKAVEDMNRLVDINQSNLNKLAGFEVNPNPSGSIKKLFQPKKRLDGVWELCDGTTCNATGADNPSIDAECLRRMVHPAAPMILKLRKMIKTRDTFLSGHILNHHNNGYIHANVNQTKSENDCGTTTGRLSINSPALQQIHKRDADIASIVRAIFLPDSNYHDWVCNDWAQMDFRVFAHYVENPLINKMYADDPDTDFHTLASVLTGIPRKPRWAGDANAKQINLGMVFGMGEGKLASEMGLPYSVEKGRNGKTWMRPGDEAVKVFKLYHEKIPGIKELLKQASAVASRRGYVKTIMNRRIRFPNPNLAYKAGGLIFQGSAAEALKVKLVEVFEYLESTDSGSRLILNVHDEFDMSIPCHRDDIKLEVTRIVTDFDNEMTPFKFDIPIRSDQGSGQNWWEASKE